MQRYTIFIIIVNAVHVSGGFSAPSSGAQELYTQQASLAHTRCCVYSSWAPDDGAEKTPETCTALTIIKNIV